MIGKQNACMTYHPFSIHGRDRTGRWCVTCDHATNFVPDEVNGGSLGLPAAEMARHIAWDPGAAGLALGLAERLDGPAALSNFSRLVIDPNRGEDDPTLLMKLYDGTIIPGNREAGPEELERRKALCYRPYHAAVAGLLAARPAPVLLSIHSFTPRLKGRPPRPWQIGVLHSHVDPALAHALIARLRQESDLDVGDNEPYGGHLPGDAVDRHALQHGRPNVLIELRQDLIETDTQQAAWAERLAPILQETLDASGL